MLPLALELLAEVVQAFDYGDDEIGPRFGERAKAILTGKPLQSDGKQRFKVTFSFEDVVPMEGDLLASIEEALGWHTEMPAGSTFEVEAI